MKRLLQRLWCWATCRRRLPMSDEIGVLLGVPHKPGCRYIHSGECL